MREGGGGGQNTDMKIIFRKKLYILILVKINVLISETRCKTKYFVFLELSQVQSSLKLILSS
jgi:hypothetical protein